MTDPIKIALIANIAPVLLAVAAFFELRKTKNAVKEVHISLNSRLDQLLQITREKAHAEGVNEEKNRKRIDDVPQI